MIDLIPCEHCGRLYNAYESPECPHDNCEGSAANVHQLAQQVLLLCMQISQRGLADASCHFGGPGFFLSCHVWPIGYQWCDKADATLIEAHGGKRLNVLFESARLQLPDATHKLMELRCRLSEIVAAGQIITIESLAQARAPA